MKLELQETFNAPLEKVWHAWTTPESLAQWFGPEKITVKVDELQLEVGGKYHLTMDGPDGTQHILAGEYKEISPMDKLVFSFQWQNKESNDMMTCTITFAEDNGVTTMNFLQEGFSSEELMHHHNEGWSSSFTKLGKLFLS